MRSVVSEESIFLGVSSTPGTRARVLAALLAADVTSLNSGDSTSLANEADLVAVESFLEVDATPRYVKLALPFVETVQFSSPFAPKTVKLVGLSADETYPGTTN